MGLPSWRGAVLLVVVLLGIAAGLAVDELASDHPEEATVAFVDENGTPLGSVDATVADSHRERFIGLGLTDSLGPDEGMLFVHGDEGPHEYVMRGMSFPIDIVFVDADGRITELYHAEVENRPYARYRGRGKWVVEVRYEWTVRCGVEVGDRVRIEWGQ